MNYAHVLRGRKCGLFVLSWCFNLALALIVVFMTAAVASVTNIFFVYRIRYTMPRVLKCCYCCVCLFFVNGLDCLDGFLAGEVYIVLFILRSELHCFLSRGWY